MDVRCDRCGFAREDYRAAWDRQWLARAIPERVRLMFEGLPAGTELPGMGDQAAVLEMLSRSALREDLHPAVHLTQAAARASAGLARLPLTSTNGWLVQVNTSSGGVPKHAITEAEVSWRGLVGDLQLDRKSHGHAWQALCLWSAEVIGRMQSEGHPIAFGAAGENLTLRGLDWERMRTGVRLAIGGIVCEVTGPAVPCNKNAQWFRDGDYRQMSHTDHPGSSRWYASVLSPGQVRAGDTVEVVSTGIEG